MVDQQTSPAMDRLARNNEAPSRRAVVIDPMCRVIDIDGDGK
jgi:hypothetical protein